MENKVRAYSAEESVTSHTTGFTTIRSGHYKCEHNTSEITRVYMYIPRAVEKIAVCDFDYWWDYVLPINDNVFIENRTRMSLHFL